VSRRTNLIRRIQSARDNTARAAAEKALAGEEIAHDVTRVKDYDKLLDTLQDTSKRTRIAAVVIGSTCLVIASIAWMVRIPSVNVHVSVETDSVTFQVARNWQSVDVWRLGTGPLRLDGMANISLPPEFAPESKLQGRAWLDIDKAQVTLSNLLKSDEFSVVFLRF